MTFRAEAVGGDREDQLGGVRDALDLLRDGAPLDGVYSVAGFDSEADAEAWLSGRSHAENRANVLHVAGDLYGRRLADVLHGGDHQLDDPALSETLADLVLECADYDDEVEITPDSSGLTDVQIARLAAARTILERGIRAGISTRLSELDLSRAGAPKAPKPHLKWLGGAAVASSGILGLVWPEGAFSAVALSGIATGGVEATRLTVLERLHRSRLTRHDRISRAVASQSEWIRHLESLRDHCDPGLPVDVTHRTAIALSTQDENGFSTYRHTQRFIEQPAPYHPRSSEAGSIPEHPEIPLKDVVRRSGLMAVAAAGACVLGLFASGIAEDKDSRPRNTDPAVTRTAEEAEREGCEAAGPGARVNIDGVIVNCP